ncbi:hypothetical protein [Luteibacter sp. 9135]|uniref:hypothetical protein n=1 Tax=Luteibacter sp. 9135 TaxID=1500893 RepID=UPI00055FB765|nr:hypothetical protein [Luteibacter sp. 9135]
MLNLLALALLSTAPQPAAAPAWLLGDWEPYSNAFTGLRLLSVGKNALSWRGCTGARFEVIQSKDDRLTLRLAGDSTCRLDDEPPSRMDTVRFTLRENRCDLAVSIYASPEAAAKDQPSAEGLYGRLKCPSGPAPHAAASLSTTPR